MQPGHTFGFRHTITAGEASGGEILIATKGQQITGAVITRRTAAGVFINADLTEVVVTSPELITLTEGAAPVWVAGETFDVIFF